MPLKSYLLACCALLLLTVTACKKKKSGDPAPQEQQIQATADGVEEGKYTAAPGTTYPLTVNISSSLPTTGVSITVTAVTDPGGVSIPQNAIPSPVKSGATAITLIGLESLRTVKVTITIASLSNPNNKKIIEFWITNKS